MKKQLIYLIRHGEDDNQFRGGWSNHKLTQSGIHQSEKLAIYLKQHCKIEKIISSDLERAKQTAKIINSLLNVNIEFTDKLREMNNGLLAGMKNDIAQKTFPGIYYNTLNINERYPGGESPIEFYNRIIEDFELIINANKQLNNIAIVTHAGVINIIYRYVNNQEWSNQIKSIEINSGSFYILEIKGEDRKFILENYSNFEKDTTKISIIGGSGSGKSTLTDILSKKLDLPAIHLDAINYKANWVETDKNERDKIISAKANEEKWIIDGNYNKTLKERLYRADLIIWLDYSTFAHLRGVFKRVIKNYNKEKPDIPGCIERLNFTFIKHVATYNKKKRPKVIELLRDIPKEKVLTFRKQKDLNDWLRDFTQDENILKGIK